MKSGRNLTAVVEQVSGILAHRDVNAAGTNANQEPWFAIQTNRVPLDHELLNLQLQEAKLLATRAPNHPDVIATRNQIDNVRRLMAPSESSSNSMELAQLKIELLKQELVHLTLLETALTKMFENEQKGVSDTVLHEVQDKTYRDAIERSRQLYETVLRRVEEISTVKDFGGYTTQVISPPLPGEIALKKYLLILALGLLTGLLIGLGSAYLAEQTTAAPAAPIPVRVSAVRHVVASPLTEPVGR
jgi:polysaccharide biosynthesis transport protein